MDPLLTRAAGMAGSALSRYAVRAVAGSAHSRARDAVYQRAVKRAVEEVAAADPGLSDMDLRHAVGLLEWLLGSTDAGDVPLISAPEGPGRPVIDRLREVVEGSGLDPGTFPLPFDRLVDVLLRVIAEEATTDAVDGHGNPLFPAAALARLDDLRVSMRTLARLTPLDGRVRQALEAAARACAADDRVLRTPHLLLALLQLRDGSVAVCFDAAGPGLAAKVTASLNRYLETTTEPGFVPVEWLAREEVRLAQTYAWSHGLPAVTGPSLLLGVLDTKSTTRDGLAHRLGDAFTTIREEALLRLENVVVSRTPGVVFDDDLDL